MEFTRAGIKAMLLTKIGQMEQSNPTDPFAIGLHSGGEWQVEGADEPIDFRNRKLRNRYLHSAKAGSFQAAMADLYKMIGTYCSQGGCDAQIVLADKYNDGTHRVLQYDGDNFMGFDFEFELSNKQRICNIMLEANLDLPNTKVVIDSATLQNVNPWLLNSNNGLGQAGIRYDKYYPVSLLELKSPSGVDLFDADTILSRSLKIKSKGNDKSEKGRTYVDYLTVVYEVSARNAFISKYQNVLNMDMNVYLKHVEQTGTNKSETYIFETGALTFRPTFRRSQSEAVTKLVYEADVPLGNISWNFADANNPVMTVSP